MRAREDIIRGLRCTGTVHETVDCTDCPYLLEETVPEDMAETLGSKLFLSCDVDQIVLDAAERLEADTETISALIDDRKYYMEKYEGLKSRVPRHNCVPPEEGAEEDEV